MDANITDKEMEYYLEHSIYQIQNIQDGLFWLLPFQLLVCERMCLMKSLFRLYRSIS